MVEPGPDADRFRCSPMARGPLRACLVDGLFLIRAGDGSVQAFDFLRDPREAVDLTLLPEYADRLNAIRRSARWDASP